jgi:hypothetical protein
LVSKINHIAERILGMKATITYDPNLYDLSPLRMKSGRKMYFLIPIELHQEDLSTIQQWLSLYVTPKLLVNSEAPKD